MRFNSLIDTNLYKLIDDIWQFKYRAPKQNTPSTHNTGGYFISPMAYYKFN